MAPVDRLHGVEVFEGFPVGSLVFREPEDNAGFYLHAPVEERVRKVREPREAAGEATRPAKAPQPSAPSAAEVDAEKDNALLDAFSAAIATAMSRA